MTVKQRVEPVLFSVGQAADYLGISPTTMRTMIHRGDVPRVDVGGCLRVRKSDLIDLVNSRIQAPNRKTVGV